MTRKDHIVIANAIREFRPFVSNDNNFLLLVNLFSFHLQEENIRFDRSKFMNACGVEN